MHCGPEYLLHGTDPVAHAVQHGVGDAKKIPQQFDCPLTILRGQARGDRRAQMVKFLSSSLRFSQSTKDRDRPMVLMRLSISAAKTAPDDLVVLKRRFSALVQGSSGLDQILRQKGIDTLLIVGTATNVCCESTLRDGMMMNYKCIMVSDANATHTDEEHNATLAAVAVRFGDVRTSEEVVALLNARPNASG